LPTRVSSYWPTLRNPVGALGATGTACDNVTVRPAIVAVAERTVVPVCAATARTTLPLPLPVAPEAMLIQDACSEADQVQPVGAVTAKVTLPPARATACEIGDTVKVHAAPV
jgi:hypothetical protein